MTRGVNRSCPDGTSADIEVVSRVTDQVFSSVVYKQLRITTSFNNMIFLIITLSKITYKIRSMTPIKKMNKMSINIMT